MEVEAEAAVEVAVAGVEEVAEAVVVVVAKEEAHQTMTRLQTTEATEETGEAVEVVAAEAVAEAVGVGVVEMGAIQEEAADAE